MSDPILQLKQVKKTIGNKQIIKGLDFEVYEGEVFGFLGPNGAGKTTTIRMLVGLMSLTEGDVVIKGTSIRNNYKKAVQHVGGIVENPELYSFMSGWKNLLHYARMIPGISKERIDEVVKLVGLENRIKEKVGKYSLGMRQRLGIAQALLHKPSILILDEPTNGLDPSGIREIRSYIRRLAREDGVAVIVSSHILSEMEMMCDRIGVIKEGELLSIQSVESALQQPEQRDITLEVQQRERARKILSEWLNRPVKIEKDSLAFKMDRDDVPEMIRRLVDENIDVYSVNMYRSTLEDKFLDLIGERAVD
ncbi:ABC transporter ATP-binding protein [Halobacillus yeomjeoni]|uniref:ABC transporter ATP-binding protein n=1 Tax=Halobacillus yeomjeoni TaxID=311194 RepID=UPI001CD73535|nr:ABC transporter ATP-binding protein [Halobacillus yeomjeoni]MCA0985012.1 ABC transporter ATP-binding protein [Halobacillus yeomjeoni]